MTSPRAGVPTADDVLDEWLAARRPAPPPALARRLREVLRAGTSPGSAACVESAEALLARLLDEDCAARGAALDLLVADSLVTYAFEIAADDPSSLESVADRAMRRIAALAERVRASQAAAVERAGEGAR